MGSKLELMGQPGRSFCCSEDNSTGAAGYEVLQSSKKSPVQLGEDSLDLLGVAEKDTAFDLGAPDHTRENSCSG